MPKKTYKLLRFDGGISNNSDKRDIADNEFAELQNLSIDEMGVIRVLGDMKDEYKSITGAIHGNGTGFYAISTDHSGLVSGSIDAGQVYYLVENGNQLQVKGDDGESGTIAVTAQNIIAYYVDGALRLAEADLTSGNTIPKWKGYIPSKTYGPSGTDADASISEQWALEDAEVAGAFPTFEPSAGDFQNVTFCQNAIVVNEQDNEDETDGANAYSLAHQAAAIAGWADGTVAKAANSGMRWGVALEFDENESGTGSWMPSANTRYKFYITTMYDDHTQESLPQLMQMFPSSLFYDTSGEAEDRKYDGKAIQAEMGFTNGDTFGSGSDIEYAEMCAVWFAPVIKLNYWDGTGYTFGSTDVLETGANGNPRISGVKIYWSSNEDGFSSLWQMFDVKFDEGIKAIGVDGAGGGTGGYAPMIEAGGYNGFTVDLPVSNKWTNPPRYIQYSATNGHSHTDTIKIDAFKTAVVANRRVYIGNVKQDGVIHGDRMLKSPVNQFDKFPSVNNIDVAIHDGDEITALVEYADRILQFKKNACYIINVSGNTEFLESEHKFKGAANQGAICKTDYGIAWLNSYGCFFYDGKSINDLLEKDGIRKIKASTWESFISTGVSYRIGFNPFKRQLVCKGGGVDNAYVYDMVTQSWTYSSAMVSDIDSSAAFINDPLDGALMTFDESADTIDKWSDTPVGDTTPPIVLATKDIDFGEPAVKKKLYKIYITYRGGGASVTAKYRVNGGSTDYQFNSTSTPFSDPGSTWTTLELKPSTSSHANNIYSCQLRLTGSIDSDFEINDITFVYREKNIK